MLDTNLDTAKRKSIPYSVLRINTHSKKQELCKHLCVSTYMYEHIIKHDVCVHKFA